MELGNSTIVAALPETANIVLASSVKSLETSRNLLF